MKCTFVPVVVNYFLSLQTIYVIRNKRMILINAYLPPSDACLPLRNKVLQLILLCVVKIFKRVKIVIQFKKKIILADALDSAIIRMIFSYKTCKCMYTYQIAMF